MIRSVAVLALEKLAVFEFGVVCEVFGMDREADGVPNFDFRVCGLVAGKPIQTSVGAQVTPEYGLEGLNGADVVAVPAVTIGDGEYPPEALRALRAAAKNGATVL